MPTKATLEFLEENGISETTTEQPTTANISEPDRMEQAQTADSELFELLLNAKNLTEEKIKTLKRILIDTNPYNVDGTGKLNPINLEKYLKDKGISIRYDDILHDLEITGFKNENAYGKEQLLPAIRFELEKYLKQCTPERLQASLTNIALDNHYNPILQLIDGVKYDGKDHLQTAYEVLGIDDSSEYDSTRRSDNHISRAILKTWLKQTYCMLHNGFCGETFALDYILILQGRQGKGKTSFFRKLALKIEYFGEGKVLDLNDKDKIIEALTKFITELGEIDSTFKKDISRLKAFLTTMVDEYRKPYGQTYMKYPRLTSFCGTVNNPEFLVDTTGNRRFGVIPIDDSHDIMKYLDRLDALQLWAQIREIVNNDLKNGKTYANCFRDRDVQTAIEARNTKFQKPINGELEVKEIIESERAIADSDTTKYKTEEVYMTASQFKALHDEELHNFSIPQIIAALERNGIPREKTCKRTYNKTSSANAFKLPFKHKI